MTVSYRQHLLHLEKMQNEATERDRDDDLMSFVGRYSDCGDARWTPPTEIRRWSLSTSK
jgi:hypothetical protein